MPFTVKKSESWSIQKVKVSGLGGGFKTLLTPSYVPTTKNWFSLGVTSDSENKLFLYSGTENYQSPPYLETVPYGFVWSETKQKWTKKTFGPQEDTTFGRSLSTMTPTPDGGIMLIGGMTTKSGIPRWSDETCILNAGLNSWQSMVSLPTNGDLPSIFFGSPSSTSAYNVSQNSDSIFFYSPLKASSPTDINTPAVHNKFYSWDEIGGWEEIGSTPVDVDITNPSFFSLGVREDSGNKIALLYTGSLNGGANYKGSVFYKWLKTPSDNGTWSRVSGMDSFPTNIADSFPTNIADSIPLFFSTITWQKDYNRWISAWPPFPVDNNSGLGLLWSSTDDGLTWNVHTYDASSIYNYPQLQPGTGIITEQNVFVAQNKPDPWENSFYYSIPTKFGPAILKLDVPADPSNSTVTPIYLPELPPPGNNTFCPIWDPYNIQGSLNVSSLTEGGSPVSLRGEINTSSPKLYGDSGYYSNFIIVTGQETGQVYTAELILDEDSFDPPSESNLNGQNPYIDTLGGPCFSSNSINQYVTTLSNSGIYRQEYTAEGLTHYLKCFTFDYSGSGTIYYKLNVYKGSYNPLLGAKISNTTTEQLNIEQSWSSKTKDIKSSYSYSSTSPPTGETDPTILSIKANGKVGSIFIHNEFNRMFQLIRIAEIPTEINQDLLLDDNFIQTQTGRFYWYGVLEDSDNDGIFETIINGSDENGLGGSREIYPDELIGAVISRNGDISLSITSPNIMKFPNNSGYLTFHKVNTVQISIDLYLVFSKEGIREIMGTFIPRGFLTLSNSSSSNNINPGGSTTTGGTDGQASVTPPSSTNDPLLVLQNLSSKIGVIYTDTSSGKNRMYQAIKFDYRMNSFINTLSQSPSFINNLLKVPISPSSPEYYMWYGVLEDTNEDGFFESIVYGTDQNGIGGTLENYPTELTGIVLRDGSQIISPNNVINESLNQKASFHKIEGFPDYYLVLIQMGTTWMSAIFPKSYLLT